jgi:hypothetical protein
MSQYRTGTVSVTNGSAVVTGVGTSWLAEIDPGDLFIRPGDNLVYFVSSVASDVSLSLTAPYGGVTGSGLSYVLHRDFTPDGIPLMQDGDLETVAIYNRLAQMIYPGANLGTAALADLTTSPTDTDPTHVTKAGDNGQLKTSNPLETLTLAADWEKPSGYLGFIRSTSSGVPYAQNFYASWLTRRDAANGYGVELVDFTSGRKFIGVFESGGVPAVSDWIEVWSDVSKRSVTFEPNETNAIIGIGFASSATTALIALPVNEVFGITGIAQTGTVSIKSVSGSVVYGSGLSAGLSAITSERMVYLVITAAGMTTNQPIIMTADSTATKLEFS